MVPTTHRPLDFQAFKSRLFRRFFRIEPSKIKCPLKEFRQSSGYPYDFVWSTEYLATNMMHGWDRFGACRVTQALGGIASGGVSSSGFDPEVQRINA